jgi:DNA-binding GntR family transcriptional regulator
MSRPTRTESGAALIAGNPSLPMIEKSSAPLRRNVVDALRTAIIEGRLAPGARLIERELIQMTGVSRTVIREALRQLESEGVVATIPNKGPVVRQLTLDEAKDLYTIRGVLEGLAAKMFVANASAGDIAELKRALDDTFAAYREGEPDLVLNAKNRFYEILTQGAGSEILSQMLATLHARIRRWRALGLGHPKRSTTRSRESVKGLRDLLEAIRRRDADGAEEIARREVTNAGAEIMRILQADPSARGIS